MPTYEYECHKCGKIFLCFQPMTDKPIAKCPNCPTGKVKRLISAGAAIIFKGTGFYATDHRSEEYKGKVKKEKERQDET